MKKLTALSLSITSFFTMALPAYAQVGGGQFSLCTSTSRFKVLCDIGEAGVGPLINAVITILLLVGVIVALAFLIYGGIKWITSGGDKAKVEAARGTIVAAMVGLVLVFLSYFIINLIFQFFGIGSLLNSAFNFPTLQF